MTTQQIQNEYVILAAGEHYCLFYNPHSYLGRLPYEIWNADGQVAGYADEASAYAMWARLER